MLGRGADLIPAFQQGGQQAFHFRQRRGGLAQIGLQQPALHIVVQLRQAAAERASARMVERAGQLRQNSMGLRDLAGPLGDTPGCQVGAGAARGVAGAAIEQTDQLHGVGGQNLAFQIGILRRHRISSPSISGKCARTCAAG
jgi:hypothetical protein